MNYTFSNNSLTFQAFEIKIDDFFTLIDGQLNLKTKDYFLSTKFFKNNDLDNFLSLNLSRTNNKFFNSADNSTSINNTDINVDFDKALDYVEPPPKEEKKVEWGPHETGANVKISQDISGSTIQNRRVNQYKKTGGFVPFSGKGNVLGRK